MSNAAARDFYAFARPGRAIAAAAAASPFFALAALFLLASGLYLAVLAPAEWEQGVAVKIMFVHVPAAWNAMMIYALLAFASALFFITRAPIWDAIAAAAAPAGAVFTLLALATGALWGRPVWGSWWVWDARLTSVLILFFIYLGYAALRRAIANPRRRAHAASLLALAGAVNLPVVKFSVDWWQTLHQPASIIRLSGPAIGADFLAPLVLFLLAYCACFALLFSMRLEAELRRRFIAR